MEWMDAKQAAEHFGMHIGSIYRHASKLTPKDKRTVKGKSEYRKHALELLTANSTYNTREKGAKRVRKGEKKAAKWPQDAVQGEQRADAYEAMPVDALMAEIRARISDKDAEIARLIDQVNRLQDINIEQGKIIGRMALEMGQGKPTQMHYVTTEDLEPEPEATEPPKESPRADLVGWLKAMKAADA